MERNSSTRAFRSTLVGTGTISAHGWPCSVSKERKDKGFLRDPVALCSGVPENFTVSLPKIDCGKVLPGERRPPENTSDYLRLLPITFFRISHFSKNSTRLRQAAGRPGIIGSLEHDRNIAHLSETFCVGGKKACPHCAGMRNYAKARAVSAQQKSKNPI
jgi:hypothetical protein